MIVYHGTTLEIQKPDMELQRDVTAIRMNVDDFDEAYGMLMERGFKNFYGDRIVETGSARSAIMISPSGFAINLVQHVKGQRNYFDAMAPGEFHEKAFSALIC